LRVAAHSICGGTSDTISLQVSMSPKPVLTPAGHAVICSGDTLELQTMLSTAATYSWLRDGVLVSGATGAEYSVMAAGEYHVVSDNGICIDTSLSTIVEVNPLPVPVIVHNNGILSTTQSYTTYQWRYNGAPITGATNAQFKVSADGDYSVIVTDSNGCTGTSAVWTIGDNRVEMLSGQQPPIHLYPNPVTTQLLIQSPSEGVVNIYTMDGLLAIGEMPMHPGTTVMDVHSWPAGCYLVYIRDQEGNILYNQKILKQ